MYARCPLCFSWTLLPAHYPASQSIRPTCEGCGTVLPVSVYASRYAYCPVCRQRYLADYGACPVCPSPTDLPAVLAWQHLWLDQTPAVALAPLSDRYCLALWQGYQWEQSGARDRVQGGGSRGSYANGGGKAGGARGATPQLRADPLLAPAPPPPAPPGASAADLLPAGPLALFELEPVAPATTNGNGHDGEAPAVALRTDEGLDGVEYELIQDSARLVEVADLLAPEPLLGVDTETDGLDPFTARLLLLQVATPQKAYIVDCQRVDPLPLKPILEGGRALKLLQNAKFDYKMLKHVAGISLGNVFDTMLAERLLTAGRGREVSLRQLAMKYAGIGMDKTIRKSFINARGDEYLAPAQLTYAARDALIMFAIYRAQAAELKKLRMTQVGDLEFQCVAAVGDMELAGVKIDTAHWRSILQRVAVDRDRAAEELNQLIAAVARQSTMFGVPTINLNSGPQLIETFGRLGIVLTDTSEATLIKAGDHDAVKKLLDYRSHEKTLSAFGEHLLDMINPKTGRLHPDFNQYGADTGRFSCTNPNVQQIPTTSDFRSCFIAEPGYKLVTCLAEGTRVATGRGLLPIESLAAGDSVLQEDGSVQPVGRVIDQGLRATITLTTAMGYELTATPEHRIRVLDGNGDYVWRQMADLQREDQVAIKLGMPFDPPGPLPALPGLQHAHFNAVNRALPAALSTDLSLLLGYITGDGTFCPDYVGFVVSAKDEDVAQHLTGLCKSLFGYHPKPVGYRGVIDIRLYSMQIKQWLRQIGSAKDHVPTFLWTARREFVGAYLRGLFEADGSVHRGNTGRVSFSTVHEGLAREVQELLALLGIAATRSKIEHGKGCGFIWFLTIPAAWKKPFLERVGFLSARKTRILAEIAAIPHPGNGHRGITNLARKADYLLQTETLPPKAVSILRNVHYRRGSLALATANLLQERYPRVSAYLGLEPLVRSSLLFDKVASLTDVGPRRVYDLTVAETSTYIARGFVNHNCDYSQAELRILAELSGDPSFVQAFIGGGDLHAITASQMFQVPLDQVTKAQRSAAKSINFGLAYGRGAGSLATQLGVPPEDARALIDKYFQAYAGIQQWLDKAARDAVRKGYSETPLGRRRFYDLPSRDDPEYRSKIGSIERQGKNTPIQGCLAGSARIFEQAHGYVPIRTLAGQEVQVWDGERFATASVAASGKKQLVRVHLYGGHYIECSPDHRFLTRGTAGRDIWKTPGEFKAQDRVVLTGPVPAWAFDVVMPPISAQLGHVGHRIRVTATQPQRFHTLTISSRGLAQQLHTLGIKDRVPDCAWQNSRMLAAYLRGMFDGDGTVNPDGAFLVFGQGRKHLAWAREIQEALLLLGIRSRVGVNTGCIHVRILKKDMPLFCERIGFMNPAKQAKAQAISAPIHERIYGRAARVKQVEATAEWVEMYDVVNSATGRFMANGLVVHNSNADMTKIALVYLRSALQGYNARVVNTVHDEIVVEAIEDQAEAVKEIVEHEMVRAGEQILKRVPVVADASIGDYWKK